MRTYPRLFLAVCMLAVSMASRAQADFPYPEVPALLTEPSQRLAYVLENFWANYQFADTTEVNQQTGEQGFVDFINLMQYADSAVSARGASRFINKAFATQWGRRHYVQMADHYLDNPDSPMRNDLVYAHLLRAMQTSGRMTRAEREKYAYRLMLVLKNQPGKRAADFQFVDRKGRKGTLYGVKSDYTVLLFNDPDCESCRQLMPKLLQEKALQGSGVTVLAVYPDVDVAEWKRHPRTVPQNWLDAYSPRGEIMARQLYYLHAMPSLYLLDADKVVILKDAPLEKIVEALGNR